MDFKKDLSMPPSLTFKKSALLQLTNIYFNEEISGRNQKKRADMSD